MNITSSIKSAKTWFSKSLTSLSNNIEGTDERSSALAVLGISERDLVLIRTIKRYDKVRDFAAARLGVTLKEVEAIIDQRNLTLASKVRMLLGDTPTTFKRFITFVGTKYDEFKQTSETPIKKKPAEHIKQIRRLANTSLESKESLFELVLQAYFLFRTKQ